MRKQRRQATALGTVFVAVIADSRGFLNCCSRVNPANFMEIRPCPLTRHRLPEPLVLQPAQGQQETPVIDNQVAATVCVQAQVVDGVELDLMAKVPVRY